MNTLLKTIVPMLVVPVLVVPVLLVVYATMSSETASAATTGVESDLQLAEIMELVRSQQRELATLNKAIETLRAEVDVLRAGPALAKEEKAGELEKPAVAVGNAPLPGPEESGSQALAAHQTETAEQADKKDSDEITKAQQDDPTRLMLEDFSGALRLPGTNAAIRIGGYVKTSVVYNFDPLASQDRFIVGSIPTEDDIVGEQAASSISVAQSRLNFELREPTKVGLLRSYIEADFAEDNDTFRLRHAFGQWNRVLAGKTWSAFVDTEATPEEIDFEGLNGRVNVRQGQVRLSPRLGEEYEFQFSMEDPNPSVQNGDGVARFPDLVASMRIGLRDKVHLKVGALLRQVRAEWDEDPGNTQEEWGGGITLSGRIDTPRFDERDNVLFQLNVGRGIGRYINDLSSIGDFDGIFNPVTGELELLDVTAAYISSQHWWGRTLRSNLTLGYVSVDNPGFVDDSAYEQTLRASFNLLWSPMPRILLGSEFLWGRRDDEGGSHGDATQWQFAAKYRF